MMRPKTKLFVVYYGLRHKKLFMSSAVSVRNFFKYSSKYRQYGNWPVIVTDLRNYFLKTGVIFPILLRLPELQLTGPILYFSEFNMKKELFLITGN